MVYVVGCIRKFFKIETPLPLEPRKALASGTLKILVGLGILNIPMNVMGVR
jgi:hypothetical protein